MNAMNRARTLAVQILPAWAKNFLKRPIRKFKALMPAYKFSFPYAPDKQGKSHFPCIVNRDNLLEKLGEKYLPSKRGQNYLVYYWMHFRDIRLDVKSVLEIGVQTDRSIRMWEEFFPNAMIYGIDIDPKCKEFEGGRRKILIGDQSDSDFLHNVLSQVSEPFDIIIDDGSHCVTHQLKSFDFLFPHLSDHGIYVIEDTGGCVGDYDLKTVNALKTIIDHIMYWPDGFAPGDWPFLSSFPDETKWITKNVIGIAFYRWIVFAMRGRNPQDNPFLQPNRK